MGYLGYTEAQFTLKWNVNQSVKEHKFTKSKDIEVS